MAPSTPTRRLAPEALRITRLALFLLSIGTVAVALALAAFLQFGLRLATLGLIGVTLGFTCLVAVSTLVGWRGRATLSAALLITALLGVSLALSALTEGIGLILGITLLMALGAIVGLALTGQRARRTMAVGVAVALAVVLLDLFFNDLPFPLPWTRLALPEDYRTLYLPLVALAMVLVFGALLIRQFPRFRLGTKLLLGFLVVALVPLALISLRNDQQSRELLRSAANQTLLAAGAQTAAALDSFINTNLAAVQAESRLTVFGDYLNLPPAQRAGSAEEQAVLQNFRGLQDTPRQNIATGEEFWMIQAYALLDTQGRVAIANSPTLATSPALQGEVFTRPNVTGEAFASPVHFAAAGDARFLYFSAPVIDVNRQQVGVLVSQISADWLQRVVRQAGRTVGAQTNATAALFDEHTLRLADGAASADELRFAAMPEPATLAALLRAERLPRRELDALNAGLPALAAQVAAAQANNAPAYFTGAAFSPLSNQETPSLAVLFPLQTQPWVVMMAEPERVALAPAQAQTRLTLLTALAFALAVAALAALAARDLTRPLGTLTLAAERVQAGDLSARAELPVEDEIGRLAQTFNTMTARLGTTLTEAEQLIAERTAQLQATADISRATAGVRNLDQLLELVVEMIRGRFGYYHASVFLLDELGEYAILRESTGEIGAALKARQHRLAVGSRSLVGWVTQNRRLRVARDVAGDALHFKNPLLPETRSELCLPLIVGERLLGALDVQSRDVDAFNEADLQSLQVLADQLSIAIENAELFQQTQTALLEAQAMYQQTLTNSWRTVVAEQGLRSAAYVYDLEPGGAESENPLQVPLRLRGEVVGVIELHGRPGNRPPSAQELAVLETIAAQLATALESAALVQESQSRSRRDQLITAISDEIRATLNPAFIVQNGIRQLGRALGATEVTVRLQPDDPPPGKAV